MNITIYPYHFDCSILVRKILKLAKKKNIAFFFKEGFIFKGKYYICLEIEAFQKLDGEDAIAIESTTGEFWRIPLRKGGPKNGLRWWPSEDQIPNKEVVKILKDLYAFLKA